MTTLERIEKLVAIVNEENAKKGDIPIYNFFFDDRQLMNVKADNATFPVVFFEEYKSGYYRTRNFIDKVTNVELYFLKLCQMENEARYRERLREQMEEEFIKPFIRTCLANPHLFERVENWNFQTPPPRFDTNEVSVLLTFEAVYPSC